MKTPTPLAGKVLNGFVLASSIAVGLSAMALGVAVFLDPKPAWALFGFELVTLVAAALGVLFGLGRFHASQEGEGIGGTALALACIAGTIFVAAVLGWKSVTPAAGEARIVGGIPLTVVEGARVLIALVLAALAAGVVLAPEPKAWRPAVVGSLLGAPVAGFVGAYLYPGSRGAVTGLFGNPIAAVVVTLVLGGLLAASVHLIIRAFEIGTGGSTAPAPSDPRPKSPAT